jgi:hypothetical protein
MYKNTETGWNCVINEKNIIFDRDIEAIDQIEFGTNAGANKSGTLFFVGNIFVLRP